MLSVFAKVAHAEGEQVGRYHWQCSVDQSSKFLEVHAFLLDIEVFSYVTPFCKLSEKKTGLGIVAFYFVNPDDSLGVESDGLVEVNIWQAGSETFGVILGVSLYQYGERERIQYIANVLHIVDLSLDGVWATPFGDSFMIKTRLQSNGEWRSD